MTPKVRTIKDADTPNPSDLAHTDRPLTPSEWTRATSLAEGIVAREDAEPVALSNAETQLLAAAYLTLRASVRNPEVVLYDAKKMLAAPRDWKAPLSHLNLLPEVLVSDLETIIKKDVEYNGSWKKRGGSGAFHMLARKWDRLENAADKYDFNIFRAALQDGRTESVLDDIADLRRYLALVHAEVLRLHRGGEDDVG